MNLRIFQCFFHAFLVPSILLGFCYVKADRRIEKYMYDLEEYKNSVLLFKSNLVPLMSTENGKYPWISIGQGLEDNTIFEVEGVSPECNQHYEEWQSQLQSSEPEYWAQQMIDAWGKIPEGLLSGHFAVPGDFDECLGIRATFNISNELTDSKARYCYTNLVLDELPEIPFQFGTCYPYSCSKEDVTILQNNALAARNINGSTTQNGCYTDDPVVLSAGDVSMITVLTVLCTLCMLGTLVDLVLNRNDSTVTSFWIKCLVAFSVYTNTKKWLGTKSSGDNFGCIHGIRFLSTCWVVLCHTCFMILYQPMWNFFDIVNFQKDRWTIFPILNGTVSVDTFFTIGGLLVSYNLLQMLDKSKGKLNVPMFYLHRYLRLTPTYALLIGIMATWFVYLGDGPKWVQVEDTAIACQKYWWRNLLYINNLWPYVLGPNGLNEEMVSPIQIAMRKRGFWRMTCNSSLCHHSLASVAVPFSIHYDSELVPTLLRFDPRTPEFMGKSYIKPWMRIGPYMIGLWTGFLLQKFAKEGKKLELSKIVVICGWCISTGTAFAILFGIMPYFELNAQIPNLNAAFYAGFHRLAWGVVISWIIVACTQGYGGFVNTFLSWKVFMPLGRLSFCVYLISFQLQLLFHSRVRQAVSYDVYTTTNLFLAHLFMSFLVGFICCMTMESPFMALEKLIFSGGKETRKTKQEDEEMDTQKTTKA